MISLEWLILSIFKLLESSKNGSLTQFILQPTTMNGSHMIERSIFLCGWRKWAIKKRERDISSLKWIFISAAMAIALMLTHKLTWICVPKHVLFSCGTTIKSQQRQQRQLKPAYTFNKIKKGKRKKIAKSEHGTWFLVSTQKCFYTNITSLITHELWSVRFFAVIVVVVIWIEWEFKSWINNCIGSKTLTAKRHTEPQAQCSTNKQMNYEPIQIYRLLNYKS